jgi:UDP:flavonoid glycosyltransferase YjiC (YdhE family)
MEITILAIGSRGDVQPLVALGLGLQAAGHKVCVATHATFERVVRNSGLGFFLLQANPKEILEGEAGQAAMEGGSNPLRSLQDFARMINPAILQTGADCWAACQEADVILYSPLGFYGAPDIAEKLDIPAIGAYLQPIHRTRAFPSYAVPNLRHLGGIINRLTYLLTDVLFWLPYRSAVNQFRQEQLNLPPISRWVNYARRWQQHMPVIYGFSPNVVSKPPDWGDHIEITGYWFVDKPADWQPPPDLVDFLAAGPSPVYIGFGSMSSRKPEQTTGIALKALARTEQRGLLATGWGGLAQADLPHNVFKIEAVPHDWLFPQMAAVVHHGGAGTTAAGLRAGVPTITVPHFTDQPFWGRRVADLGVGPQPIPRKQLSVERLAEAIEEAVSNKEMQRRVAALGERIRDEDGVARAVEAISLFLSHR